MQYGKSRWGAKEVDCIKNKGAQYDTKDNRSDETYSYSSRKENVKLDTHSYENTEKENTEVLSVSNNNNTIFLINPENTDGNDKRNQSQLSVSKSVTALYNKLGRKWTAMNKECSDTNQHCVQQMQQQQTIEQQLQQSQPMTSTTLSYDKLGREWTAMNREHTDPNQRHHLLHPQKQAHIPQPQSLPSSSLPTAAAAVMSTTAFYDKLGREWAAMNRERPDPNQHLIQREQHLQPQHHECNNTATINATAQQ